VRPHQRNILGRQHAATANPTVNHAPQTDRQEAGDHHLHDGQSGQFFARQKLHVQKGV
jgi:hypothetical protein